MSMVLRLCDGCRASGRLRKVPIVMCCVSAHSVPQFAAVPSSDIVGHLHRDNAAIGPVWPHGDGAEIWNVLHLVFVALNWWGVAFHYIPIVSKMRCASAHSVPHVAAVSSSWVVGHLRRLGANLGRYVASCGVHLTDTI